MAKPITFPKTGEDTWTNVETGVYFIKRYHDRGYKVFDVRGDRLRVVKTRAEALAEAKAYVEQVVRPMVASAYDDAIAENAARNAFLLVPAAESTTERVEDIPAGLCLRADPPHIPHMRAVSAECRDEQNSDEASQLTDATHLTLIDQVDDRTGASVGMWRGVDAAPTEWGKHFTEPTPLAPADLNDDAAWQQYIAALPAPTTDEYAAVIAEFGDPYAPQVAACREVFADAARSIWRHREAGTLTPDLYTARRMIMRVARECIATYARLTQAWARRNAEQYTTA